MRTKETIEFTTIIQKREQYIDFHHCPPELQTILAWAGIDSITVTWHDRTVTYTPWEYECEACLSYEHSTQRCPHLQEDVNEHGNSL